MINIQIFDSYGTELSLYDIVVVHYRNPKIKYIGMLIFDSDNNDFKLSDGAGGWTYIHNDDDKKEKIGSLSTRPDLLKELGRIDGLTPKQYEKLLNP